MFKNSLNAITRFLLEEDGPTTVEYAVIVSLIMGVCFTAVLFLGGRTNDSFDQSSVAIAGAFAN